MRTESAIKERLHALLKLELESRLAESASRTHRNCRYNFQNPADLSDPEGPKMGFCGIGLDPNRTAETWSGVLCFDDETARRCPTFNRLNSVQSVLDTFWSDLQERKMSEPILQLIWVLEDQATFELPWWKMVWYRFKFRTTHPPKKAPSWLDEAKVLKALREP